MLKYVKNAVRYVMYFNNTKLLGIYHPQTPKLNFSWRSMTKVCSGGIYDQSWLVRLKIEQNA